MDEFRAENAPPPPGIFQSIKAGFDAVSTHVGTLFLPMALNLFFWLGPRLQMTTLLDSVKADMVKIWQGGGFSAADIQRALQWYQDGVSQINLFWMLSALPVGVGSLQFLPQARTPLGDPALWQASEITLLGALCGLPLLGWLLGGLYFRSVAKLAQTEDHPLVGALRALSQTVLLALAWSALTFLLGIPLLLIFGALTQLTPALAGIAALFLLFASMWLIVPLYFWSYGIFLHRQNAFAAWLGSWKFARASLPLSSLFVTTIFILTIGLNSLWYISPPASWVTLLAVFGQSFTATALLAGSFIYYRDMSAWVKTMLAQRNLKP
ncbi:MAG: hypothetical protein Fur002_03430 [Anaerolineales bacterium]